MLMWPMLDFAGIFQADFASFASFMSAKLEMALQAPALVSGFIAFIKSLHTAEYAA